MTKVLMVILLVLMVILAINSILLGPAEDLKFFLIPDFKRMTEVGVGSTIVGAMTQALFTLSLGIGSMAIFGSHIGKEHSLINESTRLLRFPAGKVKRK